MKNYLSIVLFISLIAISFSCKNENDGSLSPSLITNSNTASGVQSNDKLPVLEFATTEHDFGKIVDGVKVSFTFKCKNTGNGDLIISAVKTSCGCTASKFTKEPIPPGGEGRVQLTFDGTHRRGFNNKVATVIANCQPNTQILKITAMVVGPEEL